MTCAMTTERGQVRRAWLTVRHSTIAASSMAVIVVGISPPAPAFGGQGARVGDRGGPGIPGELELIDLRRRRAPGRLVELSGVWFGTGDLPVPLESEPATPLGPAYTLTWLALGPPGVAATDRTIRQVVYPYAENGPIIHTQRCLMVGGRTSSGGLPRLLTSTWYAGRFGCAARYSIGGGSGCLSPGLGDVRRGDADAVLVRRRPLRPARLAGAPAGQLSRLGGR